MIAGWAAMQDRVLPRLLRHQAGARPGAQFLRIEAGPAETFGQLLAACVSVPALSGQHGRGQQGGTVSDSGAAGGPATGGPLAGIRVIDLSRLAPGPYGSTLLADLGPPD